MKSKKILTSSIASLLLTSIAASFVVPGLTTFAARTPGKTGESTSQKITKEKKPKKLVYADKKTSTSACFEANTREDE